MNMYVKPEIEMIEFSVQEEITTDTGVVDPEGGITSGDFGFGGGSDRP